MIANWCIQHPWMTFIIVLFLISMIGSLIEEILNVINNKTKLKEKELDIKAKQD